MNKRILTPAIMPGRDFKRKLLFKVWKFVILIALALQNCNFKCTKIFSN